MNAVKSKAPRLPRWSNSTELVEVSGQVRSGQVWKFGNNIVAAASAVAGSIVSPEDL